MTFHGQSVGHLAQHLGNLTQQVAHVGLHHRAAAVKHGAVLVVHDLDAQAVGCHVQTNLRAHGSQLGVGREHVLHLLFQLVQARGFSAALLGFQCFEVDGAALGFGFAAFDLAFGAGEILATAFDDVR